MAESNFVDYVKIYCRSGKGGRGSVHLRREKYIPNGGPDGGDGGRGGHVILRGNRNYWTLLHLKYDRHVFAEHGGNGSKNKSFGKDGADKVIEVPCGTVAYNAETGEYVCDITEHGQEVILLKGGRGGLGNWHFRSATRQAPRYAQPGEPMQEMMVILELKLLADVGLVGFPNAGKSTLLSTLSSARPKIANYPFTTLEPNLGIVSYRDGKSFVMADIPGIIEGASEGKGLGLRFLRHIERTRLLIHVLDISGSEGRDPVEDFEHICDELVGYGDLAERPQIVAANKMDLPGAQENLERLRRHLHGTDIEVYPVSAATRQGFDELMGAIVRILPTLPQTLVFEEEPEVVQAEDAPFTITKESDDYYIVEGKAMEQLIGSINFQDDQSVNYFHRTLRSRGVIDALRAAGAKEGDTVAICDMEFDFVE